jgi:hypothetical protein
MEGLTDGFQKLDRLHNEFADLALAMVRARRAGNQDIYEATLRALEANDEKINAVREIMDQAHSFF